MEVYVINSSSTLFFFPHTLLNLGGFYLTRFSSCYLSMLFFLFESANMSETSLLPLSPGLSVSDEGRDLLSYLTVWAILRVFSPTLPPSFSPCLLACLAVPPHHTSAQTTKTLFAASERVPACPSIPTSGEDSLPHCYALIAC